MGEIIRTQTKECCECKITKPLGEFYRENNNYGYSAKCKSCCNNKDHYMQRDANEIVKAQTKECNVCGYTKLLSEFYKKSKSRQTDTDKHQPTCKKCWNERRDLHRLINGR